MSFIPKKNTLEQIQALDKEFFSALFDIEKKEKIWSELHEFFSQNFVQDYEFQLDYWRWYTILSIQNLQSFSQKDFLEIFIKRQIVTCLLLGYDAWDKIIWYFALRAPDVNNMEKLFRDSRDMFFNSNSLIGQENGKNITIQEFINEIKKFITLTDSLEKSQMFLRLKNIFSLKEKSFESYYPADPDITLDRFVGLVNFFVGVESNKIFYLVNELTSPPVELRLETNPESISPKDTVETVVSPTEVSSGDKMEISPDSIRSSQVKEIIDSEFEKDEAGQYKDIEGVFAALEELSEETGNEKIREFFYFDEKNGGFVWAPDNTLT